MKRRDFLKVSGIGTTAFVSSGYLPSVFQERKIKIGLIGAGWYGMVIFRAALKAGGVEITAVCDVDSDHLNSSSDELEKLQGTRPKTFKYFPELLDQKNLEVIFIGTIPHWHALQFIAACKKGNHCSGSPVNSRLEGAVRSRPKARLPAEYRSHGMAS
jgi:hypothetical protein